MLAANPFNVSHHVKSGFNTYDKLYYGKEFTQEDEMDFFYTALWHTPPLAAHILSAMGLLPAESYGYARTVQALGGVSNVAFGIVALEVLPGGDSDTGLMDPDSTILSHASEFVVQQWWNSIDKKETGWGLFEYNR